MDVDINSSVCLRLAVLANFLKTLLKPADLHQKSFPIARARSSYRETAAVLGRSAAFDLAPEENVDFPSGSWGLGLLLGNYTRVAFPRKPRLVPDRRDSSAEGFEGSEGWKQYI